MTTKKSTKTEIKETEAQLPVGLDDMEAEAGHGFEDSDSESYAIPFLRVLQDLSPQVKKQRPEFIEGAQPGMLLNTVSQEVYDADSSEDGEGVIVIPCHYRRAMIEWTPRNDGGGFVQEHEVGAERGLDREGGKFILPNGNELQDTRYHYVILVHPSGDYEPALITMSSTQITASKRWMSVMQGIKMKNSAGKSFTPPMFSHKYRVQTKPQSNDQGDWHGFHITKEARMQAEDSELYEAAKQFREAVRAGEVKEQQPEQEGSSSSVEADF